MEKETKEKKKQKRNRMKKETKEKKNGTYFFIKIVLTYCEKKLFVIG